VLIQLKFPINAAINTPEGVSPFQVALTEHYPVMRQEQQLAVQLPQGVQSVMQLWRLTDLEGAWAVVLGSDFVAMETSRYTSRADLLERWSVVLDALVTARLAPAVTDRLGVRYTNQIVGDEMLSDLEQLVRPEVLGICNVELPEGSSFQAISSQAHFILDGMELRASWGVLPPNIVMTPGIDSVDDRSWVFDIDVYAERLQAFSQENVNNDVARAAEQVHSFFRWAVTEEFLRGHGGEV